MFDVLERGLFSCVRLPQWGQQDIGVSPGGCLDRLSYDTGNTLLSNPPDSSALEIIFAPRLKFLKAAFFVLIGAQHKSVELSEEDGKSAGIDHACVCFAPAGSTLSFGKKQYGFRTYLCWRDADNVPADLRLQGRFRGAFDYAFTWPDKEGRIRVVEGPEYNYVQNGDAFASQNWRIAVDSNHMGLRLEQAGEAIKVNIENMISAPVSDGTVQLTPKGPIVLLRHRQTIGGYPRIFNVIHADVDLLAQYMPGQYIRFTKTTIQAALEINRKKIKESDDFQNRIARQGEF